MLTNFLGLSTPHLNVCEMPGLHAVDFPSLLGADNLRPLAASPTPGPGASVTTFAVSVDAIAAKDYRSITLTVLSFGLYWYLITLSSF